jgi:hypothetical protein
VKHFFLLLAVSAAAWAQAVVPPPASSMTNEYLYYNKMHWAGTYVPTATYNSQDVVVENNVAYVSLVALSLGHDPATSPAWWTPLPNSGSSSGSSSWLTLQNTPFADVRPYNFAPQSPGGSLVSGNNSVTLNPLPPGVISGDYLQVSGGSGTPEACVVSGVSGSSVTLNCANAHSGAWVVGSATAGAQEAANANPGGLVYFPVGNYPMYAPITLSPPTTASAIGCASWGAVLTAQTAAANIVNAFSGNPSSVVGCAFASAVTRTGGAAIQLGNGTSDNSAGARFSRNLILNQYNGFYAASGYDWTFTENLVNSSNYDMLIRNLVNGDQGDFTIANNQFVQFSAGPIPPAVIRWESAGGMKFSGNKIVSGAYYGIDCVCTASVCTGDINIVNNSIEDWQTAGIRISTSNAAVGNGAIVGNQLVGTGVGITLSGASSGLITVFSITGNVIGANSALLLGAYTDYITFAANIINGGSSPANYVIDATAFTGNFALIANNLLSASSIPQYGGASTAVLVDPESYIAFASLPTAARFGSSIAVTGVTAASNPCTAGAVNSTARRVGTAWKCD